MAGFTLDGYVKGLAKLNETHVTPGQMPTIQVFNSLAWGLVEERLELALATTKDSILKEAGDVLAYATLLLLCVFDETNVVSLLTNALDTVKPTNHALAFASNIKRHNREGQVFDWVLVMPILKSALVVAATAHKFSIADVAEANLLKLIDRADRGVMLKGSGDAR